MLYLRLAPEQFSCNKEKIFWTLAFFKDGRATKWSENLFHQEADTGIFSIQSWTDFEQQFQSQFFLVNAELDAIHTLEGSSYYQENQTVDDYLDSFLTLVSQKVTYLFCDELDIVSKELRSRVRQATKDVVKSEV